MSPSPLVKVPRMWMGSPRGPRPSCTREALGLACGERVDPRGGGLFVGIDTETLRVAVPPLRASRLPKVVIQHQPVANFSDRNR